MNELVKIFIAFGILICWIAFLYWANNTPKAKRKREEFNESGRQANASFEKGIKIIDKLLASMRSSKEEKNK